MAAFYDVPDKEVSDALTASASLPDLATLQETPAGALACTLSSLSARTPFERTGQMPELHAMVSHHMPYPQHHA